MISSPYFTVCITTYKRWESCLKTIAGVISQDFKNYEIILVDDDPGSVLPNTVKDLIEEEKLRYLPARKNLGLAASRNKALDIAAGTYFLFCDDDDLWLPFYLSQLKDILARDKLDFVYTYKGPVSRTIKYGWHSTFFADGFTPPVAGQCYRTSSIKDVRYGSIVQGVDHDLWISLTSKRLFGAIALSTGVVPDAFGIQKSKMTHDHERRTEKIKENFRNWDLILSENFSPNFINKFQSEYVRHLEMRKVLYELANRGVLSRIIGLIESGFFLRVLRLRLRYTFLLDPRLFFL